MALQGKCTAVSPGPSWAGGPGAMRLPLRNAHGDAGTTAPGFWHGPAHNQARQESAIAKTDEPA